MENLRLYVEDLELPETQERVKNQLDGIVGVSKVELSAGQDYVDVTFDDQTSSGEIHSHLQNNGYKINTIEP